MLKKNCFKAPCTYHVKMPYFGMMSHNMFFQSYVADQVRRAMPRGWSASFRFVRTRAPTIKQYLCNMKHWCKFGDSHDYSCTCDFLHTVFDLPRSQRYGHVCGFFSESAVARRLFPCLLSMDTNIVPSVDSLCADIIQGWSHVARDLKIHLDFNTMLVDFGFQYQIFSQTLRDAREADLVHVRRMCRDFAVITPVDEHPAEVCVICAYFWQRRYLNGNLNPHVSFQIPSQISGNFQALIPR